MGESSMPTAISRLLAGFGEALRLTLRLDAHGACGLRIDERLDLVLASDVSGAWVVAQLALGPLPASASVGTLRRVLAANVAFGDAWADAPDVHGGTHAVWALAEDELTLSRRLPLAAMDAEQLVAAVSALVALALEELDRQAQECADTSSSPVLAPMFGMVAA